ncbi:MAG TPA: hypothetical protein PKM31_10670, partial [Bacillota bacterium]|nr:hypothetical protein [Bacillota bacterium]
MATNASKRKARVRVAGGARSSGVMRAVVWPPTCPWPGVWLWPGPFGTEGAMGPVGRGGTDGAGAPERSPEWSGAEFRRALWIAIAIAVAGLVLGTLIAAWAGGVIPGPARLFGLVKRSAPPFGGSRAESPGGSPEGRTPAKPGPLPERPSPGYPAPGIDGRTISGDRLRLEDCAGDVVVITFFSTASGASLAHISILAQMHADRMERMEGAEGMEGVESAESAEIVAIAVGEKADAVLKYME